MNDNFPLLSIPDLKGKKSENRPQDSKQSCVKLHLFSPMVGGKTRILRIADLGPKQKISISEFSKGSTYI